jgi:hypothetical protein
MLPAHCEQTAGCGDPPTRVRAHVMRTTIGVGCTLCGRDGLRGESMLGCASYMTLSSKFPLGAEVGTGSESAEWMG